MGSSDLHLSSASPSFDLIYLPFKKPKPKTLFNPHHRKHEDNSAELVRVIPLHPTSSVQKRK